VKKKRFKITPVLVNQEQCIIFDALTCLRDKKYKLCNYEDIILTSGSYKKLNKEIDEINELYTKLNRIRQQKLKEGG